MKKAYIIHGWGGNPQEGWFVWLKKKLEKENVEVIVPEMPNTDYPKIDGWVGKLKEVVVPGEDVVLIGHSIGCQAIMRYLEQLDEGVKIGKVIFVAGWFDLTDEVWDEEYTVEIAKPWINTPIDFNRVKEHVKSIIAFFSDNDPYVPLSDSELFKERLNAEIIVLKNKGHISQEHGVNEFPEIMRFIE